MNLEEAHEEQTQNCVRETHTQKPSAREKHSTGFLFITQSCNAQSCLGEENATAYTERNLAWPLRTQRENLRISMRIAQKKGAGAYPSPDLSKWIKRR